jgi:hypothetical protein
VKAGVLLQRRSDRLKRSSKERIPKILFVVMNTLSIVFLLFIMMASQVGTTFGNFIAKAEVTGEIGICSVFPNEVEQLLGQAEQHVREGDAEYADISGYTGLLDEAAGDLDLSTVSDEQLGTLGDGINSQISGIAGKLNRLDERSSTNVSAWEDAQGELHSSSVVLTELSDYMSSVNLNCLTPRDQSVLSSFLASINGSSVASEALESRAREIYEALSGSPVYTVSAEPIAGSHAILSPVSPVSEEAEAGYEAAQASIHDASASYIQQQTSLQQQLAQVNAEIAAREKAKAEAEAAAAGEIDVPEGEVVPGEEQAIDQEEGQAVEQSSDGASEPESQLEPDQQQVSDDTPTPEIADKSPSNSNEPGGVTNETTEINHE